MAFGDYVDRALNGAGDFIGDLSGTVADTFREGLPRYVDAELRGEVAEAEGRVQDNRQQRIPVGGTVPVEDGRASASWMPGPGYRPNWPLLIGSGVLLWWALGKRRG